MFERNWERQDLPPEARLNERAAHLGVRSGYTWDAGLALEAERGLRDEEKGLDERGRRSLVTARWVDAFFPLGGRGESALRREHAISPTYAPAFVDDLRGDAAGTVSVLGDARYRAEEQVPRNGSIDARLYATDLYVNIALAGPWVRVPSSEAAAVGSWNFSCCQAVMGVSHDGHLCMAHIPGPGDWIASQHMGQLLKAFGPGFYTFVAPERVYADGAANVDPRERELAEEGNARFDTLAKAHGLPLLRYPEIGISGSVIPDVRDHMVMVLTAGGLQVWHATKRALAERRYELFDTEGYTVTMQAPEPMHDVSFATV